jgi:hypothetical protein
MERENNKMTLLNKILLGLLALTVVGAFSFIIYQQHQMQVMQTTMQNNIIQTQTLVDNIQRAQSQYVSKADLDNFAQENGVNLDAIRANLAQLGGAIDGLNNFVTTSNLQNTNNIPSTNTTLTPPPVNSPTVNCNGQQVPCPDPYGYLSNVQNLQISEQFPNDQVPFGSVSFNANVAKPWSLDIPARKYNVNTVIAHSADGELVVYNSMGITSDVDKKEHKVAIESSQVVEQYPSPSWSLFAPKVYLGVSGGVNLSKAPVQGEITPTLSASVISYGKTTVSPDLTLLGVGVGYQAVSQKVGVELAPISVNIGNLIGSKIITNTYVAPTVGMNFGGEINTGLGLRVGL